MLKTYEAKETLESMLKTAGFDKQKPDLALILNVFKEFSKIEVDCSNDAFLFQCGVFNFAGEDLFYWDIVRQFEIEVDNEYDHMEQLHFEVKFLPNDELRDLNTTKWSFEIETEEYFAIIEGLKEFVVPFEKYKPISIEVFQEEV